MADISSVSLNTTPQGIGDMPRSSTIPTGIAQSGLISTTSHASDCFVNQQFSAKLQAFLIGYSNAVFSYYSIYE
jgi:hypothetical protein